MSAIENMFANPMGTDGFEFIEFVSPDPKTMAKQFEQLGFTAIAKHRSKAVTLYRQGDINFILNAEPNTPAAEYGLKHGPSACAMGFRVQDAKAAYERAVAKGAKPFDTKIGEHELFIPAIEAIGGTAIYFIDQYNDATIYDTDFEFITSDKNPKGFGLTYIDHLTHNVYRGNLDKWAGYYEDLFNFREIRFFDIKGTQTGLISRAMTSPCGKIRIPINESSDDKSQIEEYLDEFQGEGIQHIALGAEDIYSNVEALRAQGIRFLTVPDTYYELVEKRVPWHQEDLTRLAKNRILLDGTPTPEGGLLLQIFTENTFGPVFFEIIQRKGNEGFGEGNFQALFESIELDQIRRGYLKETDSV